MKKNTIILAVLISIATTTKAQWVTLLSSPTTWDLYSVYFVDSNTGYAVGESGTIINTPMEEQIGRCK